MKMTAPVGTGLGKQSFSIKPNGIGLQLNDSSSAPAGETPAVIDPEFKLPTPIPSIPESTTSPTPFARLYPGIDPAQEMFLDDKTGRIRFKPIEVPPESPKETPPPTAPIPQLPAESETVTQLKAQLAEQNQLMTAMLQAQLTGRPLAEVLSGVPAAPAEPDYSDIDLYDDAQRAQFIRRLREDARAEARAEAQAQMRGHIPAIQDAQRHGEYFAVQAEHGKDPDFEQKVALTNQLVGNNPNISFKATYNLISQIQQSLAPAEAKPTEQGKPSLGQTVLTQAQADAKAAQAAKYPPSNGGRAIGAPVIPPQLKTWKQQTAWMAQMMERGWSKEDLWAANGVTTGR